MNPQPASTDAVQADSAARQMRRLTRRSFAAGGAAALAGAAGWWWLKSRAVDGGLPWPLRRTLEWNERLALQCFNAARLAPEFSRQAAQMPRTNGDYGLNKPLPGWKLFVETPLLRRPLAFALDDIRALPRIEMVTQLKCVEGWSVPVLWGGARLADFAAKYGVASRTGRPGRSADSGVFAYVSMSTPGGGYYVGLDIQSALHPQTLLCYEMNGAPLTPEHGAPLRLAMPVKYGYKNIKRIGTIRFSDARPADFWAERGYDWYAGH